MAATATHVRARDVFERLCERLAGQVTDPHREDGRITCQYALDPEQEPISARLEVREDTLYTGETLRPLIRKKIGTSQLPLPTVTNAANSISIPDGPFQQGLPIQVDVGSQRPVKFDFVDHAKKHLDAAEWDSVPKRALVTVQSTYLAGRDAAAYEALVGIVSSALQPYMNIELHREALIIKAFALVKWLRLIICSAYVYHSDQAGEFQNNLVPLFLSKLGGLLAALSLHDSMAERPLSGPIHDALSGTEAQSAADAGGERFVTAPEPNMCLSADMLRNFGCTPKII